MSILSPLQFAARLTRELRACPGQLVYCKDRSSITACFYELLQSRGVTLTFEESEHLRAIQSAPPIKLGRPCIILDRLQDGRYTIGFIAQIRGTKFTPLGRFFGVPLGGASSSNASLLARDGYGPYDEPSAHFPPLRLTNPAILAPGSRKGRFYFFAIPVVRQKIHLPPGQPKHLVAGDLQRAVELVRERVTACAANHTILRRKQLTWVEENSIWQFQNPQEWGINVHTYRRL